MFTGRVSHGIDILSSESLGWGRGTWWDSGGALEGLGEALTAFVGRTSDPGRTNTVRVERFGSIWEALSLNPHPFKPKGAAPKSLLTPKIVVRLRLGRGMPGLEPSEPFEDLRGRHFGGETVVVKRGKKVVRQ